MLDKAKATRTQITDLPETNVELSENELRIVAGGLRNSMACYANNVSVGMIRGQETSVVTGNDWDSD